MTGADLETGQNVDARQLRGDAIGLYFVQELVGDAIGEGVRAEVASVALPALGDNSNSNCAGDDMSFGWRNVNIRSTAHNGRLGCRLLYARVVEFIGHYSPPIICCSVPFKYAAASSL